MNNEAKTNVIANEAAKLRQQGWMAFPSVPGEPYIKIEDGKLKLLRMDTILDNHTLEWVSERTEMWIKLDRELIRLLINLNKKDRVNCLNISLPIRDKDIYYMYFDQLYPRCEKGEITIGSESFPIRDHRIYYHSCIGTQSINIYGCIEDKFSYDDNGEHEYTLQSLFTLRFDSSSSQYRKLKCILESELSKMEGK